MTTEEGAKGGKRRFVERLTTKDGKVRFVERLTSKEEKARFLERNQIVAQVVWPEAKRFGNNKSLYRSVDCESSEFSVDHGFLVIRFQKGEPPSAPIISSNIRGRADSLVCTVKRGGSGLEPGGI